MKLETIKETGKYLKQIPFVFILVFLIILHFTLLSNRNSTVLEHLISFYYNPQNNDIINFIRELLINIATISWIWYLYIHIEWQIYLNKPKKDRDYYRIKIYSSNGVLLKESLVDNKLTIKNNVGEYYSYGKNISAYNANYVVEEECSPYIKHNSNKKFISETIILYTLITRYFLDILKYHSNLDFIKIIYEEIKYNLGVFIISLIIFGFILYLLALIDKKRS